MPVRSIHPITAPVFGEMRAIRSRPPDVGVDLPFHDFQLVQLRDRTAAVADLQASRLLQRRRIEEAQASRCHRS